MKAHNKLPIALLIGFLFFAASAWPAHAVILIYKVTFSAKALLHPSNNILDTGYVIYDTGTPANSQTIQLFKNKTYQINGSMLNVLFPSQIFFSAIDKNGDTKIDTGVALVGFQSGNIFSARSYIGAISPAGFRVGTVTVTNTARSLRGVGYVTNLGTESFSVSDTWTYDTLSVTGNPGNTNGGVALLQARLQQLGYTQVN